MAAHWKHGSCVSPVWQSVCFLKVALICVLLLLSGCTPQAPKRQTYVAANVKSGDDASIYRGSTDSTLDRRPSPTDRRILMRIFWQDMATATLKYGDVLRDKKPEQAWHLVYKPVPNFPELDVNHQRLVQMAILDSVLLVGVRSDSDSATSDGWVAIDTGVERQDHGDHYHWRYHDPQLLSYTLDDQQRNPAHLYVYGRYFYLAQDKLNGFLRLDPVALKAKQVASAKFYSGGGNHITLAVWKDKWAFATWIDRQEANAGRVDVVDLQNGSNVESFTLPVGGLHGATVCNNRVFFAPCEGIYHIKLEVSSEGKITMSQPEKIDLGRISEDGPAFRTGAFAVLDHFVLFSTSIAGQGYLGIIDTRSETPHLHQLFIPLTEGQTLSSVSCLKAQSKRKLAAVFAETPRGDQSDVLYLIELDPDDNGQATDAAIWKELQVGENRIEGHAGHHSIAWNAHGTIAAVTSPGSGSIFLVNLQDGTILATLQVGGVPTAICALGGPAD